MKLALGPSLMLGFFLLSGCLWLEPAAPGSAHPAGESGRPIVFRSSFFSGFDAEGYDSRGVFFDANPITKSMDQYKVISALRMLGYSFEVPKDSAELPHVNALERYKSNHGIELTGGSDSEQVTLEALRSIDLELVAREETDAAAASRFPLYNETVSDHPNGISRGFIAATVMRAFDALPARLVDTSRTNMLDCFVYQCYNPAFHSSDEYRFIYDAGSGEPVFSFLENGLSDGVIFHDWMLIGPKTPSESAGFTYRSGGSATVMTIHEYAHFLDSDIYPKKRGTTRGLIETAGFCSISWEDSETGPPHTMKNGSATADFLTGYSTKNCWEDFAEAFAGYVAYGQDFREKAAGSGALRRKYDWLRVNVFEGVEYDTDIPYIRTDYGYVFDGDLMRSSG